MAKGKISAAVMAIAMPFVAGQEGLRTKAYLDQGGIPTICYGETENVRIGDVKTKHECNAMFYVRLGYFAYRVDMMVDYDMTDNQHAAYTSLAYNIGLGAFKKSTVLKKANKDDMQGSCDAILAFNKVGKDVNKGLINRRKRERDLCLS